MAISEDLKRFRRKVIESAQGNLHNYVGSPQIIDKNSEDVIDITLSKLSLPSFQHQYIPHDDLDSIIIGSGGVINPHDEVFERLLEEKQRFGIPVNDLLDLMVEKLPLSYINAPKKEISIAPEKGNEGMAIKGPEARRNFRQTFKKALKRQISLGNYHPGDPVFVRGFDKRYNVPSTTEIVTKKAVIINIKNASRNIESDDMQRILTFNTWAKLWLERNYDHVQSEYIVHRGRAFSVDKKIYTRVSLGGESKLSSAYAKCSKLILEKYPVDKWNIYVHHFTDGNHKSGDENEALFFLKYKILPSVNAFCYGKMNKNEGIETLFNISFKGKNNFKIFELRNRGQIYTAMGKCFGSGL